MQRRGRDDVTSLSSSIHVPADASSGVLDDLPLFQLKQKVQTSASRLRHRRPWEGRTGQPLTLLHQHFNGNVLRV